MNTAPAKTSFHERYRVAVKIDGDALRRLDTLLLTLTPEGGQKCKYSVVLSDKTEREFIGIDDLISYENSKARAITQVTVNLFTLEHGFATVRISSESKSFDEAVSLLVSGSDTSVVRIKREFETWLSDSEQSRGYSWFARATDIGIFVRVGALLAIMWLALGVASDGLKLIRTSRGEATLLGIMAVLGIDMVLLFGISAALNWMRRRFWPVGVFLIGHGIKRYDDLVQGRSVWLLYLLFPLALAVVVPLIEARC